MTFFTSHCWKFVARNLLLLHSVTCYPHFIKGLGRAWTSADLNGPGLVYFGSPRARPGWALNIGPVQGSDSVSYYQRVCQEHRLYWILCKTAAVPASRVHLSTLTITLVLALANRFISNNSKPNKSDFLGIVEAELDYRLDAVLLSTSSVLTFTCLAS